MTDAQWKKMIERAAKKQNAADELRRIAEDEYMRRYGVNPSEVDDDWWIDTIERGNGSADMTQIIRSAEEHSESATRDK